MIERIKRYFFWLVVEDQNEDWEDYWKRKDYQGYLAFRAYAGEDWSVMTIKQRKQTLANFTETFNLTDSNDRSYLTGSGSDFDIKYILWDRIL